MKIVIFSMTPLFPKQVMGGSQRILQLIATHLGQLGHEVTIVCTKRWDSLKSFKWSKNVKVVPIFNFKQPYPNPYATQPYNIANAISDIGSKLSKADRFYMHDSAFIFPYVYKHYKNLPVISSLRDFVYSETLQGAFLFSSDILILSSDYAKDVYMNTVGRFFPSLINRTKVIPNGIDWTLVKRTTPKSILKYIGLKSVSGKKILLHPHRPEIEKGIMHTISVVEKLVYDYGHKDILVLVPKWIETKNNPELQKQYKNILSKINGLGLSKNFHFHGWIPYNLIGEYYSLGSITLCLGNYPETFGNVSYESIGCGTPVIATNIGPNRNNLRGYAKLIQYDDDNEAAKIANGILKKKCSPKLNSFKISAFKKTYSSKRMCSLYTRTIVDARRQRLLSYKNEKAESIKFVHISPWIIPCSDSFYNELSGKNVDKSQISNLLIIWGKYKFSNFPRDILTKQQLQKGLATGIYTPAIKIRAV